MTIRGFIVNQLRGWWFLIMKSLIGENMLLLGFVFALRDGTLVQGGLEVGEFPALGRFVDLGDKDATAQRGGGQGDGGHLDDG